MWVLFGVLPAVAAMLLGVGVGGPRWLAPALAVAICVPFGMAAGWPDWPWLLDGKHGAPRPWLWWLLACCGLVGGLRDLNALPKQVAVPLEVLIAVFVPWLLSGELRRGWSFEWTVLFLTAGWLVTLATWWLLRRAAKAQPGLGVPLAMTIAFCADAWLLRERTGGVEWQIAGVAAVALGFAVVASLWRRPFVCGPGGALCCSIAHVGLLWCARGERELVQAPFLLALVAPLGMWFVGSRAFADAPKMGMLAGVAATALLAGIAIATV